jgi:hypothetical protein
MPNTPYGRYEFPSEGEENWNTNPGPEDIWAKQELEVTQVVSTFGDLPAPDVNATTDDGQPRRFYVKNRDIIYIDTGSEWRAIAGHGTSSTPVPDAYFTSATSETVDSEFAMHSNTIDSDYTIPAGKGAVVVGELTGTGSISGDGALAVIEEGIHNAIQESELPYRTTATVTTDYTATAGEIILADASAGPLTITLPAPAEALILTVKKIDAQETVTVATPGTETIDGDSTVSLTAADQWQTVKITSNGTDYFVL